MHVKLVIDAIVRQTTVLIAQLFEIVEPGQTYTREWHAGGYYDVPTIFTCSWPEEVPRDQGLLFEACWYTEEPDVDAGTAEETCESGTFTIEGQNSFILQVTP